MLWVLCFNNQLLITRSKDQNHLKHSFQKTVLVDEDVGLVLKIM